MKISRKPINYGQKSKIMTALGLILLVILILIVASMDANGRENSSHLTELEKKVEKCIEVTKNTGERHIFNIDTGKCEKFEGIVVDDELKEFWW